MISASLFPGSVIEVVCHDLDKSGTGICKFGSIVIFVEGLVPGDLAEVTCAYNKGNLWHAELNKLINKSIYRIEPPCKAFNDCGGCSLQQIDYKYQVQIKNKTLLDNLKRIGSFTNLPGINSRLSSTIYNYRNKAIVPARKTRQTNIITGYYRPGSHEIVNIENCPVIYEDLNSVFIAIKTIVNKTGLKADPDRIEKGYLRHIVLKQGHYTGEIQVGFISGHPLNDEFNSIAIELSDRFPKIVSIVNNIQPLKNNKIFGTTTNVLYGRKYIFELFCNLKFIIGIQTFFQVNILEAQRVIELIRQDVMAMENTNRVIDAYSGIGTISLPVSTLGIKVIGIEQNKDSYDYSLINKANNSLNSVEFIHGDVQNHLYNLLNATDYLIVDPPRKGLSEKVVQTILTKKPQHISYLSCNTATLSRDLKILCNHKFYHIRSIYTFDFFPQTTHLESLVFLSLTTS